MSDYLKNAAIIILGMGEACAAEILKSMSHKEVESIIETMNNMGDVSEQEVILALNEFFAESNHTTGINISSSEYIRRTFFSAIGSEKAGTIFDEAYLSEELVGFELLKWQPLHMILDAIEEEHPQIITAALMCIDSEKSAEILKWLPKALSKEVIHRMTSVKPVSSYAMKTLSEHLQEQFTQAEKFKLITSDGVDRAANIIACMEGKDESEIMSFLTEKNQDAFDRIQERLFPFERLSKLDGKSFQVFLAAAESADLVIALKGVGSDLQQTFFKHMSSKAAALLQDDLESSGPKKIPEIAAAQKRLIDLAKKLELEEKISLPSARTPSFRK